MEIEPLIKEPTTLTFVTTENVAVHAVVAAFSARQNVVKNLQKSKW